MADLLSWLTDLSLEKHYDALVANGVDYALLPELGENDLKELGFNLGDRKRFLLGIRGLTAETEAPTAPSPDTDVNAGAPQERRQLTLMFVDLVGSTSLSNRLELEAYRETLHVYQTCCLEAIRARNGYVAQFLGDGVVAYFGYPVANEVAAEAAVLAGIRICEKIREAESPAGEPLNVRVGIATGDVLVDKLADEGEIKGGLVFGDTPNLAARLQTAAEPGAIAISKTTRELLGKNFTCRLLGTRRFKGFDDLMEVWSVTGFRASSLRFSSRANDAATPLINREDELRTLTSRWRAARRGQGQVVCISGEAGIGKSRLVNAAIDGFEAEGGQLVSLQCAPYRDSSAFFPVISLLNLSAGIRRTDKNDAKLNKLQALLHAWAPDRDDALPVLAGLMGVADDGRFSTAPVEGDEAKKQLQTALIDIITGLSQRRPIILLFEDLHWIDPSSEELLDKLIERLPASRIMLICTFRTGYDCRWEGMARVTTLPITRLDEGQSLALIRGMLEGEGDPLPEALQNQIITRTDGVPLFVEEMVRMVRQKLSAPDAEAAKDNAALSLPATLKDLLRAQIDGLPQAGEIVSVCAVIGRVIHPALLAAVTGHDAAIVRNLLDVLVNSRILVRHGAGKNLSYGFRHAMILDVAYEALLPSAARALHRRIAKELTDRFTGMAEANPEVLARHYEFADMPLEARDAWREAALLASSRWATKETLRHLDSALACNERSAGNGDDVAEIELRKLMVVALHRRGFASPAHSRNYQRLSELLQKTGKNFDGSLPFLTVHNQFGAHLMRGHVDEALAMCDDISAVAEASGDRILRLLAAHDLGMATFFHGDLDIAIASYTDALRLREDVTAEEIFRLYPGDLRLVDGSMMLWSRSLRDPGEAAILRSLDDFAEKLADERHLFSRCYALAVLATAYQGLGEAERTLAVATEAQEISSQTEFDYWSAWCRFLIGWARAMKGETVAGAAEIRAGIDAYLETGSTQMQLYAETLLADVYQRAGEDAEGLRMIKRVKELEKNVSVRFQKPFTDRVEAALRAAS